MTTDPRFNVALKYYHAGLHDAAWQVVSEIIAVPQVARDALRLAATLRLEARNFGDVISICDRMLSVQPDDVETLIMKGSALDQGGQPDQAVLVYKHAIALSPESSLAHNNLGVVYVGQGHFAAAANAFGKSLSVDPNNVAAIINLGVAQVERGYVARGLECFERALILEPNNLAVQNNQLFALHNISNDPVELYAKHRLCRPGLAQEGDFESTDRNPNRKLRIGYVSADFRYHSVGFFCEALIRGHNRQFFDVTCYSNVALPDATTQRFKEMADQWRDIQARSTEDLRTLIRDDRIDILVDLAGHTMGNRLDVFAARATPIQITAIGYPGTTGLSQYEGRIGDEITDPSSSDPFSSEPLLRIPGGMHCYTPSISAPAVGPLPCISQGPITFGSFNKLAKISPSTIDLWGAVLAAVPHSRLLIKTKPLVEAATRSALTARFDELGISAERIELRGWDPKDSGHLDLYNQVDIALDTIPYNGTTTTCEALWMGVPVVTLVGRTHAGRVGASLLTSLGMPELVCQNPQDYIECAVSLSANRTQLSVLRAGLRQRMAHSRLCDGVAYVRAVEDAYRQLWAEWSIKT